MSKEQSKKPTKQPQVNAKETEKDEKDIKAQLVAFSEKSQALVSKYLLLFGVVISSLTIIIALLLSQNYIDPKRDETVYNDAESQIGIQEIDKEKLKTLEDSLENTSVEVEPDFVPNRNNPFSE